MIKIKSPQELGFPAKITEWRDAQVDGIQKTLACKQRFSALVQPTGTGKSGCYMGVAAHDEGRTVVLTATRGLQDQLHEEFKGGMDVANIKGKNNYTCPSGDNWTCQDGHAGGCQFKGSHMCGYTSAFHKARTAKIVFTNYSLWFNITKYGQGLGSFDRMVCDEGHHAPDELGRSKQLRFTFNEVHDLIQKEFPKRDQQMLPEAWKEWARRLYAFVELKTEEWKIKVESTRHPAQSVLNKFFAFRNLCRKLATLRVIKPAEWIVEESQYGFQLDCIDPARYRAELFKDIEKVSVVSATVRPKTMHMLGIDDTEFEYYEYPMMFDPELFRIYYVPTMKLNAQCTDWDLKPWIARANQIIGRRLDRRGLFHTQSFKRRDLVMRESRFREYFITNREGDVTDKIVQQYRNTPPPAVFVSPSITTGYDFAYDACEYQIIGKVPFPDSRSKIMQARQERDKEHAAYTAMQTLTQAIGRAQRAHDDQSETFIIDDNFEWFMQSYGHLAPRWLGSFLRTVPTLPEPLPKLEKTR